LRTVFHGSGDAPLNRPAEIRIGDSVVMVSEAGERETFPAFLYVYVDDADSTYQRALVAGAVSRFGDALRSDMTRAKGVRWVHRSRWR
jgi:hypothetical protein